MLGYSSIMKLSAAILGVAAAQYESWNYQNDYNLGDASGKVIIGDYNGMVFKKFVKNRVFD